MGSERGGGLEEQGTPLGLTNTTTAPQQLHRKEVLLDDGDEEERSVGNSSSHPTATTTKVLDGFRGLKSWKAGDWVRLLLFVGLLVGVVVVLGVFHSRIGLWLTSFLTWVRKHQLVGALSLAGLYVVATVLFVPGLILTLGGGFAFDLWVGIVTISIGSTIGACCAFLLGRYLARDWIAKKITNFPIFLAIDGAIADKGALIVLLLRLSPVIPFNLLNYALGLTRVDFWVYFPISWIGMLPGTILYVYIGHGLQTIADVVAGNAHNSSTQLFLYVGLGVTFYLVFIVSVIAKNAISRALLLEKVKKLKENDPSLDGQLIEVFKSLNPEPELESFVVSGRRLLKEGPVAALVENERKGGVHSEARHLFLFNDALAITVNESQTKEQESLLRKLLLRFFYGNTSNQNSYWLRTWVSLPVSVSETTNLPSTKPTYKAHLLAPSLSQSSSFKLQTSTKSLVLIAHNHDERNSWIEAIQNATSTGSIN